MYKRQVLDLPPPIIPIIPVVYYERENYSIGHTDSTPLIQSMNKTNHRRSTSISDPALDFLNHLLEDFSDEWLNKIMYYYRFKYNGFRNSEFLLLASNPSMDEKELKEIAEIFRNRQTHKLPQIIGKNDNSGDFLENHYIKIINYVYQEITKRRTAHNADPIIQTYHCHLYTTPSPRA